MRIFESCAGGWDEKINFVDINNVFVGYDMGQSCCENADWFISDREENEDKKDHGLVENLEDYVFDTTYFVDVNPKIINDKYELSCLDEGSMVRFKIIAPNKPYLYLHLYNVHNGYYGHGFDAKIGGIDWKDGVL